MYLRRWLVPLLSLLACSAHIVRGASAEERLAGLQALQKDYQDQRALLDDRRRLALEGVLQMPLEEQRRNQRLAKISGNTTRLADANHGVKLLEGALESLKQEDTFRFPARIRPALVRTIDLCARALESEDETRAAGLRLLDTRFAARLQPLTAADGVRVVDPERFQDALQTALEAAAAAVTAERAAAAPPAPEATKPEAAEAVQAGAVTNDQVLASRGEAAAWTPLATIEVEVAALEILSLPLDGLEQRQTHEGTGLESGAPWRAVVTPARAIALPAAGQPAMRMRAVPGLRPVDVVGWPSRRNGGLLELRVRPLGGGASRHAGLLEIDASAPGK